MAPPIDRDPNRLLAAVSLNHSLAVPLLCPATFAAMRTDNFMLNVSPGQISTGSGERQIYGAQNCVVESAAATRHACRSCPEPMTMPFLKTSARRSNLVPTSSLFFNPTHAWAWTNGGQLVASLGNGQRGRESRRVKRSDSLRTTEFPTASLKNTWITRHVPISLNCGNDVVTS